MDSLSSDFLRRYARHIVLPEIGKKGQEKLLSSSVLVVGAGGLGSSAIAYLAAAGIGKIRIVEPDRVELSNLQRQILFESSDIGRSKVIAACDRINEVNPDCVVEVVEERFSNENSVRVIDGIDIVVDGSDNFATRFVVNKACMQAKKTLVSAAISGFYAQISTFKPYIGGGNPCYNCLIPDIPEREISCAQEGIIGPLAGMIGSMQALEVIKELLGIGKSLSGSVIIIDSLNMSFRKIKLHKDKSCSCNGL